MRTENIENYKKTRNLKEIEGAGKKTRKQRAGRARPTLYTQALTAERRPQAEITGINYRNYRRCRSDRNDRNSRNCRTYRNCLTRSFACLPVAGNKFGKKMEKIKNFRKIKK